MQVIFRIIFQKYIFFTPYIKNVCVFTFFALFSPQQLLDYLAKREVANRVFKGEAPFEKNVTYAAMLYSYAAEQGDVQVRTLFLTVTIHFVVVVVVVVVV